MADSEWFRLGGTLRSRRDIASRRSPLRGIYMSRGAGHLRRQRDGRTPRRWMPTSEGTAKTRTKGRARSIRVLGDDEMTQKWTSRTQVRRYSPPARDEADSLRGGETKRQADMPQRRKHQGRWKEKQKELQKCRHAAFMADGARPELVK